MTYEKRNSTEGKISPIIRQYVILPVIIASGCIGVLLSVLLMSIFAENDTMIIFRLISVFIISASILLGTVFASRMSRSLSSLLKVAQTIATQSTDDPPRSVEEINALTNALIHIDPRLNELNRLEILLTKYLGHKIARQVLDGKDSPGGELTYATVLFADIRDFTPMMEDSVLEELFKELNDYFAMIQNVIQFHDGVINKYGGDSVLALFGAPGQTENHAYLAVKAAGAIMDELSRLNEHRLTQGKQPFRIGIGVNTGDMIVGNLGSKDRLEYTVIGDCVNTAKRLSDLSKETPFYSIFVSEPCLDDMHDLTFSWQIDRLGDVYVKGRRKPISAYAVTPDSTQ